MKKILSLLLATLMVFSVSLTGCKDKAADIKVEDTNTKQEEKISNFNKEGYPIVNEKISLKAISIYGANYGDPNKMKYWIELEKLTNINLNIEAIKTNATEKINLMLASQDYPDIMLNRLTDDQLLDATEAGQVYSLNDLIDKYAPNWKNYFAKNKYGKKVATMPDGKIWSLPIVREEESNSLIRDQWMINVAWLKELGLSMPKTTDDFYKVLKAFKDNAGKGTIPKNVIPWYFRFNAYSNGGQYELYNAFGAFTPGSPNYISVDEKGKVAFSAINPKIKDAINYMHKLYVEGLVPPEAFTDSGAEGDAKMLSKPPILGSYLKYFNDDPTEQIYDVMPPLVAPGVSKPAFRQQTNTVTRNYFTIFKKNKYPEASIRLANTIAEPDWSVQAMYGMFGDFLDKNADGSIKQRPFVGNAIDQSSPGNSIPFMLLPEFMNKFQYDGSQNQRAKNIEKVYKPYVAPIERFYPPVVWTPEQTSRTKEIETDLLDYIKKTHAHWIVDGGADQEWDAYVKKVQSLKLEEYLKIYQEALDTFNKN